MKVKAIILLLICIPVSCGVFAQRRPAEPKTDDLPRVAIDTLETSDPDTRIVLYSNNTWGYHRPEMHRYNELPVYVEHWDNSQIFSYKSVPFADLPERIDLCLINRSDEFHSPYRGQVTSKYGPRRRRNHDGVDIPLKTGEPIYAAFDGKIRYSKYNTGGYGNLVIVRHQNGLETWYAHLSKRNVAENEFVKAGQVIGYGGNTGRSTGPHLHFETRYADQSFDPEFIFDFAGGTLKNELFALERSYFNINSRASELLIEDEEGGGWDFPDADAQLTLLAEMGDTTASRQLLALAVEREQEAERARLEAAQAVYHTIVSGDTLLALSRRYGVTVDQICNLNNISRNTILRLGLRFRVK